MNVNAIQAISVNLPKQNEISSQKSQNQMLSVSQPQALQKTMNALETQGRAVVSFRGDTIFGPDGDDEYESYKDNLKILMKADNMSIKGSRVAGIILDVFDNDELETILHSDRFKKGFDKLKRLSGKEFMSMSVNGVYETLTGKKRESSKEVDSMPLHIYQQVVNK